MTMPFLDLRLATRRNGSRDGELMLVSPSGQRWLSVGPTVKTMQALLDNWALQAPELESRRRSLDASGWNEGETFDPDECMAPLPRAYQWADASVYRNHARLIYQWRNEPIPPRYEDEPLVYQGGSDGMIGPREPIVAIDEAHLVDLEAEIAVITTDVPMGVTIEQAADRIALVVLLNDVSLRGLIPGELAKGFGFYQSKPATSFAPVAVTPGALGPAWKDCMLDLPVRIELNGERFGEPHANSDVVFNFAQIIAHLARTRCLVAGSIVGAGTISNADPESGSACITEARVREQLSGVPLDRLRPYLRHGDRVRICAMGPHGEHVFGAIDQQVVIHSPG
ncbi:FAA hydrolase family protein [Verminephrobacter eiseniae]|uniref:fumarylacetoacetate hydrolase family protein n=1 Tax=Verminephrobacter eiseniae TaxID=364317 RepID=UPI0022380F82|nr:fumarylacetoacetate hydrolase family protein [Verminephrobacter eiseniae]MCW5260553.1 FAA hydrolase family protein [Verminephrobacter eiseniae]